MDTIIFSGGGLCLIVLGIILTIKHNRFISKSIEIKGVIVDVVDKVHITRGSFGQVTDKRTIKAPVIQYKCNQLYQFQSEVDVRSHSLSVGDNVVVLLNPFRPKAARLDVGLVESTLMFKVLMGLGVFSVVLGGVQFDPNDFNLSIFNDLFTVGIIIFAGMFLYIKLSPMFGFLRYMPIYSENAHEVVETEDI